MLNYEFTEKQVEIMETALELIAQEGIKNSSFRVIAKRLGVTEPAIYRHFENRSQFTALLYMYVHRSFAGSVRDVINEKGSFEGRLHSLLSKALMHIRRSRNANFMLLAYSVYKNDKKLKSIISQMLSDYSSIIKNILDEAVKNGEMICSDTGAHAQFLAGLTQAYALNCTFLDYGCSPEEYLDPLFKSYIKGLKKGDEK